MLTQHDAPVRQNQLLASLPIDVAERLASQGQAVELTFRDSLFRTGDPMPDIYFPLSGIVSLIAVMTEGNALETGVVGREGLTPLVAFLGVEQAPQQALIQMAGQALRVPVAVLRQQAREAGPLHDLLERYTAATLLHTTQTTVCNGLHPVEERLARWLLLAQDRAETDQLPMTHEFLGLMLGVRRASVTTTVAILQQAGLIRSHYGTVEVVDRDGLERASCECYARMRDATEQVFAGLD